MPEPEALLRRRKLGDGDAINLTIVEDDGFKLPNCLAPAALRYLRCLLLNPSGNRNFSFCRGFFILSHALSGKEAAHGITQTSPSKSLGKPLEYCADGRRGSCARCPRLRDRTDRRRTNRKPADQIPRNIHVARQFLKTDIPHENLRAGER
jgi:hypothetical protein